MTSRPKVVAALLLLPLLILTIPFSAGPLLTALVYAANDSLHHYLRRRQHGRPPAGAPPGSPTYRSAPAAPPRLVGPSAIRHAVAASCSFFGLTLLTGLDFCFRDFLSSGGPFLVGALMLLTWQTFTLGRAFAFDEAPGGWQVLFVGLATLAAGTLALVSYAGAAPVDDFSRFFASGPKVVLAEPFAVALTLHACLLLYAARRLRARVGPRR